MGIGEKDPLLSSYLADRSAPWRRSYRCAATGVLALAVFGLGGCTSSAERGPSSASVSSGSTVDGSNTASNTNRAGGTVSLSDTFRLVLGHDETAAGAKDGIYTYKTPYEGGVKNRAWYYENVGQQVLLADCVTGEGVGRTFTDKDVPPRETPRVTRRWFHVVGEEKRGLVREVSPAWAPDAYADVVSGSGQVDECRPDQLPPPKS